MKYNTAIILAFALNAFVASAAPFGQLDQGLEERSPLVQRAHKPPTTTAAANDDSYALAAKKPKRPRDIEQRAPKPPKTTAAANDESYALAAKRPKKPRSFEEVAAGAE